MVLPCQPVSFEINAAVLTFTDGFRSKQKSVPSQGFQSGFGEKANALQAVRA